MPIKHVYVYRLFGKTKQFQQKNASEHSWQKSLRTTAGTIRAREMYSGWFHAAKKENCMVGTSKMCFLAPHWLATKSRSPVHYLQSIHAGLSRQAQQLTLKPRGWPAEQLSDPTCTLWHRPLFDVCVTYIHGSETGKCGRQTVIIVWAALSPLIPVHQQSGRWRLRGRYVSFFSP